MRSLIAGLFAILILAPADAAAVASASPGRLEFEILRNGEPAGRHVVEVSGSGEAFRAASQVDIRIDVGPVTVFRYAQTCRESWTAGALATLDCSTLKGGRRTAVSARREGAGLVVTGAGGDARFAASAIPANWWLRPPASNDTMIDTETGRATPIRVTRMGRENFTLGGRTIQADRIRVQGTLTADLWYDTEGRWVGCAFTARGQRIEYRLVSPLSAAPARA